MCQKALLGAKIAQSVLEARTCAGVHFWKRNYAKGPSWEPEHALRCPLGSQNMQKFFKRSQNALLGAKLCVKVRSWEPNKRC